VYNGRLIAGGTFTQAGGQTANRIAAWDGTSWQPLGTGPANGVNGTVSALAVYDGRLIAGGPFWQAGGQTAYHIAAWDGTSWQRLGTDAENGLSLSSLGVAALTLYNGRLIAGGGFTQAGGQTANAVAAWDGTSWQSLGTGAGNGMNGGEVRSLTVYNGRLIAGGNFVQAGFLIANRIAAWDGTSWQPLGTGAANGVNGTVSALTVYNGRLIAGGTFTQAGGQTANRIAAWNGTSWSSFGTGLAFTALALSPFDPDGPGPKPAQLTVGGSFGTAGGKVSPFFAVYGTPTDSNWSAPTGGNAALTANWACSVAPDAQQTILFDRVAAGVNLQPTYTVSTTAPVTAKRLLANTDQVTLSLSGQPISLTAGPSFGVPPVVVGDRAGGFDARLLLRNTAGNPPATFTASGLAIGNVIDPLNNAVFSSRDAALTTRIAGSIEVGTRSRGTLEVRDGSTLRYGLDDDSYIGAGLYNAGAGTTPNATISVTGGGKLESATFIRTLSLGSAAGARSTTTISGTGSRWNAQQADLFIGDLGSATVNITGGGQLLTSSSNSAIVGRQPTSSASVTIGAGSNWTETLQAISIGGAGGTSQATVTVRAGGSLSASAINIFQGGVLTGTGTIQGDVFNVGTLRPGESPGTLTIEGDYRQVPASAATSRSGVLDMEVAGEAPGQADKLIVTGPAELGGGLFVNFLNNYRPAPNTSLGLQLVSAGVLDPDARFDVAYLPPVLSPAGMPDGRFLKVEYPAAAPLGIRAAGDITLALGSLGSPITYLPPDGASVDGTPTGVAIGDLNGDGLDDLAISVPSSANPTGTGGSVVVLINRGGDWQGFPSAGGPGSIQLATANEPRGLVIADIDGDGRKDLAVANASSNTVTLFANTTPAPASATFAPAGSVSFPGRPVDLVADNFNGPDRRDLAVACEDANLVSVRRSVGAGFGFDTSAVSINTGNRPRSVAAFNPDQDKDVNRKKIAVANFASNTVGVINTSAGSVGGSLTLSPLQTINVAPGPVKVVAQPLVRTAGVNRIAFTGGGAVGQGRTVLITVNQSAASNATASVIAPNPDPDTQATVPFNPAVDIPAGIAPRGVIAADLDADLDDELVIVTNVGTTTTPDYKLRVLRNDLLTGTTANQQLAFVFDRDIDAGVNPLFVVQGRLVTDDPNAPRDLVTVNDPPAIASSPADAATLGQEPNIRPLRNRTTTTPLGCSPADIANTDGDPLPDNSIDNGDFTAFFNAFFLDSSDPARLIADIANTDGDTTLTGAGPDGTVDNGDFTAFFNYFFEGCGIL
jgi:T5SS/PEP-CTERM-associated repeat protein